MKKTTVALLAVGVLATTVGMTSEAAGLRDMFNAEYYANQYPDLYKAFGYNEDALYEHFINHGIKEGRVMNPVIDIVKYRENYADLNAAFGDDWDSYVKHYIEFGIKEQRDNGTDFDPIAYVSSYADIKEAFGNDFTAVIKHYSEHGVHEEREEASKEHQEEVKREEEERREAAERAEEEKEEQESNPTEPEESIPAPEQEPMSVTLYLPCSVSHAESNQWYDKLREELDEYLQMDITWEWEDVSFYYDQVDANISSGNVSDVMIVDWVRNISGIEVFSEAYIEGIKAGLFWDLTDYIDDYDNLATIPEQTRECASYNGRMYGIPRQRNLARYGFGYRLDWLNNLNLIEPTTWEAFTDMLYAFTYNDPDGNGVNDTVGLYLDSWTGSWDVMMTWFGVPNEWGVDANGDLIHKSQTQEYKTALAAFRELYAQGVINNGSNGITDFRELNPGVARNTGLRKQLGGCGIQVLDDMRKVQTYFEEQGITTTDNIIFTLQGYVDTGLGALCYPTDGMANMIVITKKNVQTEEQLRQVLQMLNDLNDGECLNLIEYGWEGLTYEVDENGYVVDYDEAQLVASGVGSKDYMNGFNQVIAYFTADANARPVSRAGANTPITILEQQLLQENSKYCVPNYGISYEFETYEAQEEALEAMLEEVQLKYIVGEIDDNELAAQLQAWMEAGGTQVTEELNALYHAAGN